MCHMYLPDSAKFGAAGREQFSSVVPSIFVTHYFAISMETVAIAKSSERIKSQHLYHVTFFRNVISDAFRTLF